jgi:hypothetical protein
MQFHPSISDENKNDITPSSAFVLASLHFIKSLPFGLNNRLEYAIYISKVNGISFFVAYKRIAYPFLENNPTGVFKICTYNFLSV